MLEKKLVTIACVVGILLCGACFGPVYRPPTPRPMNGERVFLVSVSNQSATRHVDPDRFTADIVDRLNANYHAGIDASAIHAQAATGPGGSGAVLKVTVLQESAALSRRSSAMAFWQVTLVVSARLVGADGAILWNEPDLTLQGRCAQNRDADTFDWAAFARPNSSLSLLAFQLQQKMLYVGQP